MQGADFHIGDGESSEEAFNNPVFLQGWVIPPFLLQKGQRGTAAFAHRRAFARLVSLNRRKKDQVWESWRDVHTWTLLSG